METFQNLLGFEQSSLAPAAALSRLTLALVCGGLIGLDPELHERPAGLRTHMLVSMAASLFTILTFEIVASVRVEGEALGVDPIRVVEALTAGVAFLAAGTIIVNRGSARGLTTGASLWLAGAAGLATGLGLYWLAFTVTGLALLVLIVVAAVKIAIAAVAKRGINRRRDEPPTISPPLGCRT